MVNEEKGGSLLLPAPSELGTTHNIGTMPGTQSTPVRGWCFTLNNYTDADIEKLELLFNDDMLVSYAVYGYEVGENGTPHLQGYVNFTNKYRLASVTKLVPGHLEKRKGTAKEAAAYCMKDGNFKQFGKLSKSGGKTDALDALTTALDKGSTLLETAELDPATYVRNYRGLIHYQALKQKPYEADGVRGIWIYGPPGVGKSWAARVAATNDFGPSVYLKPQSKWWDGYADQKCVILDDADGGCVVLGHHIKIWADRYACSGEVKGGTVHLQHQRFVVTSNYHPRDLWEGQMLEAIVRRFKIINRVALVEHMRIFEETSPTT